MLLGQLPITSSPLDRRVSTVRGVEGISHPAYRLDQLCLERLVDLGTQTSDRYLDYIRIAVEVHVPYLRCDKRLGQDLPFSAHQKFKQ